MIGTDSEFSTKQEVMEFLDSKHDYLSSWEYFFSAGESDLDAKQIGFSVPSSNVCESIAPTPYGEASQARTTSRWGSKCVRRQVEVAALLRLQMAPTPYPCSMFS